MTSAFTLKRCLLLCLPALALGLWLRALTLYATPEALLSADTNSYWDCVSRLWNDGKFGVPEKRRWLYPLLLMAAPALPGSTPQAVAFLQHALGLVAIVGVGWVAGQLTRWRECVVPLATLLFAASPRGLGYEHQIIADSAMTNCFILAAAVALPLHGLTPRRLAWTLALCAVVVALKPHGKPLALPIIIAAVWFARHSFSFSFSSSSSFSRFSDADGDEEKEKEPRKRLWLCANALLLALCGVLFLNAGSSRQGGWLLLSSTLPLVPESGEPFPQYRAALAPVIREARALGNDFPWEQYRYKKLLSDSASYDGLIAGQSFAEAGPEWNPLTRRKDEFARVTSALARSGLRAEPLTWLRFTFVKIARGLADPEAILLATFRPAAFWEDQRVRNEERWLERPKAIALIYEMNRAEFDDFMRQRTARAVPDVTTNPASALAARMTWFTDDHAARRVHWTWIGVFGALGFFASLRRANAWPVLGAGALSLLTSFAIGDTIARYVYPVEWLLFLLPLLGVAALFDLALLCKCRLAR